MTLPAGDTASAEATTIFKNHESLQRWADDDQFWQAQPYGNRFYFGAGPLDYVPRDVLRAVLASASAASSAMRSYATIPACGDMDCNSCDLVSVKSPQTGAPAERGLTLDDSIWCEFAATESNEEARATLAESEKPVVTARLFTQETSAYLDRLRFAAREAIRTFEDAGEAMSWAPTHDAIDRVKEVLQGGYEYHPDDAAVDKFAEAMRDKMEASREKGRGGWDSPFQCSPYRLANMLIDHLAKGDPVDVGNFAMMLFNRPDARGALARVWALRFDQIVASARTGDEAAELRSRFPEINFSNYTQDDVEGLQAWAFEAYEALANVRKA